jgi:hypothetical protein
VCKKILCEGILFGDNKLLSLKNFKVCVAFSNNHIYNPLSNGEEQKSGVESAMV